MPSAAPKPCTHCGVLVRDGSSRCIDHKVKHGSFADKRRGSRHQRGYGTAWDKLRIEVLRRDAGLCQPCMREGHVTPGCNTVDHIAPKAEGGTDDLANLQAICTPCHRAKTQAEAARGAGGYQKSGPAERRTDRFVKFPHAQVSTVGGVKR